VKLLLKILNIDIPKLLFSFDLSCNSNKSLTIVAFFFFVKPTTKEGNSNTTFTDASSSSSFQTQRRRQWQLPLLSLMQDHYRKR
jgi:hypothetical protein